MQLLLDYHETDRQWGDRGIFPALPACVAKHKVRLFGISPKQWQKAVVVSRGVYCVIFL